MALSSARQRVIVCLGIAIYCCLPMQASLHRAVERHHICVEHGHLAHGSGDAPPALTLARTALTLAPTAGLGAQTVSDDDHCDQTHTRPDHTVTASWNSWSPAKVLTPLPAAIGAGRLERFRSIPLLREAPKQSPPV